MKQKSDMKQHQFQNKKGKVAKTNSAQNSPTIESAATELVNAVIELISTFTSSNSKHCDTKRKEVYR